MINKIYKLENGLEYLIVKEKDIDYQKYVLAVECNYDKDEINEDEVELKKVTLKNDEITLENVDENIEKIISQMLND